MSEVKINNKIHENASLKECELKLRDERHTISFSIIERGRERFTDFLFAMLTCHVKSKKVSFSHRNSPE